MDWNKRGESIEWNVDYIPWIDNPATGIVRRWSNLSTNFVPTLPPRSSNLQRLGLSQEALALQAEVDRTYVSQLSAGSPIPRC
jgi:hypothetical protein